MFAVIDIGSNSVRLGLFEGENCIEKTLQTTRLGEGLHQTGSLSKESVSRTLLALRTFLEEAKKRGAEQAFAYATEAVRRAKNGGDFIARVREELNLTVTLLSGEEEAETGFLGAIPDGEGAILDIGGASTELAVKGEGVSYRKSIPVGCVVLKNACGENPDLLTEYCKARVREFSGAPVKALTGIGGTATTLAALSVGMKVYDGKRITGQFVSKEGLASACEFLSKASVEQRVKAGVPKGRADVIYGGAIWLYSLLSALNLEGYTASDEDNLEGYARLLVKRGEIR